MLGYTVLLPLHIHKHKLKVKVSHKWFELRVLQDLRMYFLYNNKGTWFPVSMLH